MNFLLGAICAGAFNYQACVTSLEQAAIQTGITDYQNQLQQYTEAKIRKQLRPVDEYVQKLYSKMDKRLAMCVGTAYKLYNDKGIVFSLNPQFVNQIDCELHPTSVSVKFKWIW